MKYKMTPNGRSIVDEFGNSILAFEPAERIVESQQFTGVQPCFVDSRVARRVLSALALAEALDDYNQEAARANQRNGRSL